MHLYDVRAHTDTYWLKQEKTFWFKLRAEFLQLKMQLNKFGYKLFEIKLKPIWKLYSMASIIRYGDMQAARRQFPRLHFRLLRYVNCLYISFGKFEWNYY